MIIAGIMSGSSLDGLDVAIVAFKSEDSWVLKETKHQPYEDAWVERLQNYHTLSASEYIMFTHEYSRYVSLLLKRMFSSFTFSIDYVSFHGHTLVHLPERGITEQIGNGGVMAATLGIPTITDFRIQDVTLGGQGTPLAPLVETRMFKGHDYYLNLGGIANITVVEKGILAYAYDVCPCNQVLNHFAEILGKPYDENGALASKGRIQPSLHKYLSSISYFHKSPPKSLDNNWIKKEFIPLFPALAPEDVLHTYCHWMADAIASVVDQTLEHSSMMVTGGGTHNLFFIELLGRALNSKSCSLHIPSNKIIDFKEAILMSLLGYRWVTDQVNVLSKITGASRDTIGGSLYKA